MSKPIAIDVRIPLLQQTVDMIVSPDISLMDVVISAFSYIWELPFAVAQMMVKTRQLIVHFLGKTVAVGDRTLAQCGIKNGTALIIE